MTAHKQRGAIARWARRAIVIIITLVVAVPVTLVVVYAIQARVNLGDLRPWHTLKLTSEFDSEPPGAPATFEEYKRLEDSLFAELHRRLLDDSTARDHYSLSRYNPGSVPAQLALETPYNRSFALLPDTVRGGVLLVHGLTDSP